MNDILIKRLKSLAWRLGCVMALAGLSYLAQQLTGSGLPDWGITLGGLLLGEATKWVTDHTSLMGAARKV